MIMGIFSQEFSPNYKSTCFTSSQTGWLPGGFFVRMGYHLMTPQALGGAEESFKL